MGKGEEFSSSGGTHSSIGLGVGGVGECGWCLVALEYNVIIMADSHICGCKFNDTSCVASLVDGEEGM